MWVPEKKSAYITEISEKDTARLENG